MANNVEKRFVQADLEVRSEEGKPTVVEGYAAVFGDETVIGGAFAERVARNAFEGANMSNTVALFNHDMNQPLARVGHGLEIEVDERGLKYRFELGNQSYAKDLAENIRMGNVTTSSFGFTVKEDSWERRSDGLNLRTIEQVDLLFDVSPTTQGAYPTTEVGLRSMEAALTNAEVAELEEEVLRRSEEEVLEEDSAPAAEEDCGCEDKAIEPVQRAEDMSDDEEEEGEEEETEERIVEEVLVDQSILPHPYGLEENPEPEARSNNNNSKEMENKEKNAPAYIQGLGDVAEKLQKRYDFGKAIREAAQGRLTGLEAEMNQEARAEFTGSKVNISGGINVPSSMLTSRAAIGIATVDNTSAGGTNSAAFGGTIGKVDSGLIGSFQPADLASQLGVRNLTNSSGDIVFQVQTTDPTIGTPAEAAAYAASNPGFAARTLQPKRYSAHVQVTEQLLAQSSQDMGAFIAQEIRKAVDAKFSVDVDAAIVTAADDHETAAGTMDNYHVDDNNITHLEAELLGRNVDVMNVRAACSPVAYRTARISSFDAGSGLVFAGSPRDRIAVIGYPAAVNSKVANNGLYLLDVTQMVQATWGGMNLIIDPYTDADKGVVRIIANIYRDIIALNHDGFAGFVDPA